MIECRPIRREESDEFLSVMCDVFELDQSRAAHVFYSEPFFDINRKWALFENHRIATVLTLTPLKFGWGDAVGVAGVATLPSARRRGHASRLLESSLSGLSGNSPTVSFLFATNPGIYARTGFSVIDEVISGVVKPMADPGEPELMSIEDVQAFYDNWAEAHPDRLRRDAQRWRAWQWVYRPCEAFAGGYLSNEPMLCREALMTESATAWPVVDGTRWMGLKSLTSALRIPASNFRRELLLMGRNAPGVPQMFMTDQF